MVWFHVRCGLQGYTLLCASVGPELWSVLTPNTHIPSISALLTLFNIATTSLTLSFLPLSCKLFAWDNTILQERKINKERKGERERGREGEREHETLFSEVSSQRLLTRNQKSLYTLVFFSAGHDVFSCKAESFWHFFSTIIFTLSLSFFSPSISFFFPLSWGQQTACICVVICQSAVSREV